MISDNVILIFGVIIINFVLSTNCGDNSEEMTEIKSDVKKMQDFLIQIKDLDNGLKLPESYDKLGKIKTHIWRLGWNFGRHIKNKEDHIEYFEKAYKKFVDISTKCIDEYLKQFDTLGRPIGTQKTRADFLLHYNDKFAKKMVIKGQQTSEIQNTYNKLNASLTELYTRIYNMVDVPLNPQIVFNHHPHSSSSSSNSHSSHKHKSEHEVVVEHHHDKSESDHSHGAGELVAAGAVGALAGVAGTLAVEEMTKDSSAGDHSALPPPAPVEEEVEVSHKSASSSSSAQDQDQDQNNYGDQEEEVFESGWVGD